MDNDTIIGNDGDDMISGNIGDDKLTGGFGADTFYAAFSNNLGHDTITDFNNNQGDRIIVSNLDNITSILEQDNDIIIRFSGDSTLTLDNNAHFDYTSIIEYQTGQMMTAADSNHLLSTTTANILSITG